MVSETKVFLWPDRVLSFGENFGHTSDQSFTKREKDIGQVFAQKNGIEC